MREPTDWGGLEQQAGGRYRLATRVWAMGGRGEAWQRPRPAPADAARTVRYRIYRDELLA